MADLSRRGLLASLFAAPVVAAIDIRRPSFFGRFVATPYRLLNRPPITGAVWLYFASVSVAPDENGRDRLYAPRTARNLP